MKTLTIGELRILNYVLESKFPVSALTTPRLEELVNRTHHGIAIDLLPSCFMTLLDEGLLEATIGDNVLSYNRDSIKQWLKNGIQTYKSYHDVPYYRLTTKGGELLEEYLELDWTDYFRIWPPEPLLDLKELEVSSASEGCMRTIVKNFFVNRTYEQLWHDGLIKLIQPWQGLYWKEFDFGYVLEMLIDDDELSDEKNWYCGLPNGWQKNP
jgi:hypothetical protein